VIASLLFFCLVASVPAGAAQTLKVPDDFATIQAAIDAAGPGDTVHIRAGHYKEALVIRKPLRLEGAGRTKTVVESPDVGQNVVTVAPVSGTVVIETLAVRGGKAGVYAIPGEGTSVELTDVVAIDNQVGVRVSGRGQISIKRCGFFDNIGFNAVVGNGLAEIEDSEFLRGGIGILLAERVQAHLCRNVVALGRLAIAAYVRDCEYSDAPTAFAGTLSGTENRIYGTETDLCPPFPEMSWPEGFLEAGWTGTIRQAVEAYDRGAALSGEEKYIQALEAYEEGLRLLERAPLHLLEAYFNQSIGGVYWRLGLYQEALTESSTAGRLFDANAMYVDAAKVGKNIGEVYASLGLYREALFSYQAAREVFAVRRMDVDVAKVDLNIAIVYEGLGQYEEALEGYRAAREVFAAHTMGVDVAKVDENIGVVLRDLGRYEEALEAYRAARETYASYAMDVDIAEVDQKIGVVYRDLGRYEEALEVGAQALATLDRFQPLEGMRYSLPATRWTLLSERGLCFEELERWDEAFGAYTDSIAVVESIGSSLRSETVKHAWGEQTRNVYERQVDLLFRRGEGRSALPYAERCRARTLLDLLAAGPAGTLENASGAELHTGVVDPETIETDLLDMIASLPPGTAAVEYFVAEDTILVWVITQAGVQEPLRLEIRREDLASQVIAFRQALETEFRLGNTADEALLTQSRDLYALLVQPIEDKLAGMTHVVIIPSGPLHYLPFAALLRSPGTEGYALWSAQFESGTYFGDRYALSYAPSLVALKYAQEAAGEASADRSLLALADPDSGDPAMARLPDARAEAEAVAALFPVHAVYVGREATETVVQSQSSTVSQLLFSTHGLFNAVNPMYSYLVLAPTDGSDGRLHTYEVFSLDLHADLVVLSACDTLLPSFEVIGAQTRAVREAERVELSRELMEQLTSGDEVVGLTRAFLYAGTPSVLASLWSVYSEATKDLMVAFYGYLDRGLDKAEALQAAQRDARKLYPHPVFWAAFNLIGDWR
jgi:CHAT domain-containing protein